MTTNSRIFFKENPYPLGHGIKAFSWSGEINPATGLVFHFHLETDDYYADDTEEVEEDDEEQAKGLSDWEAKNVWGNYHSCTLSSTDWGDDGIRVTEPGKKFDFEKDLPRTLTADLLPLKENWEPDDLAFSVYLLGHDSCANHNIHISPASNNLFNIKWTGKLALSYVAEYEFKYDFEAFINEIPFDGIHYPKDWTQEQAMEKLAELVVQPAKFSFEDLNPKSFKREYKLVWNGYC